MGLLIASPGFLTLSCSCMQEIPALAPTLAALWLLLMGYQKSWRVPELAAGILFGVAMEIKIISAVLMPLAALIIWVCVRGEASRWRNFIAGVSIVALTALASTVATDLLCSGGSYLAHFQQSWRAHFGPTRSLECGSPRDRPFQWIVLLRNWDTTIPALVGIMFAIRASRTNRLLVLPAAWLLLNLGVFGSGAE
jgi:4-amino-4-deoxy-L-arabinose transferase-like glycosyltransferase